MGKPPKTFDSAFEIYSATSVIGEGGSGRVFSVKDSNGSDFALKCLFPERVTTERRKRFKNEINFCQRQKHANIIQVVDAGIVEWNKVKCLFYVMPLYEMTLRILLEKGISANNALKLFTQIIDGVEAGHLSGVIHRDLKPENVLYDQKQDRLLVADFGIARFEEDIMATTVSTKPTTKLANLRYSAPEQRIPGAAVDRRADVFALGLILNELFTNSVPQGAGYKTIKSVAAAYSYLDPLVDRMIQQNPAARFSTLEEVKKELIASGNEFVALQQLRAKEQEVVPVSAVGEVVRIQIINVDWQRNTLMLKLSRNPEQGWIQRFQQPRENYSAIMGAHPSDIDFRGDTAFIRADEQSVEAILNHFKIYLEMADRGYLRDLENEARTKDYELRQKLATEKAAAEQRARVLKTIRF